MIINGSQRRQGTWFTNHLLNEEKNESVRLVEVRNIIAQDVAGAFREMKAIGSGTRCKDYFYHANINILAHEHLTPEQWEKAVDALEKKLASVGHDTEKYKAENKVYDGLPGCCKYDRAK